MTTTETRPDPTFEPYAWFDGRPNRYAGHGSCGSYVYAGEGYYNGQVYCSAPGNVLDTAWLCEVGSKRTIAEIIAKRNAPAPTPRELTADEIARQEQRRAQFAAQDAAWESQGLCRCNRCGGAGGSTQWPGFTCYDCGGSGAVICND